MSGDLQILAGKTAYNHIRKNGLAPEDIKAVLGASGAAKWLVLYGLDAVLFTHFFRKRTTPLHLFGTSIGAWKLAAAAQKDPWNAFTRLKDAYIHQYYNERVTPDAVSRESRRIIARFLGKKRVEQILSHPFLHLGFSAVRCKGPMVSDKPVVQISGVGAAYAMNRITRHSQKYYFERTFFHDPRYDTGILAMNDFPTTRVCLTENNFSKALLASGSIPIIMAGISRIPGAPEGVYRDGGLLDYHPAFPLQRHEQGLILYPHFYPEVIPGWFDKTLSRRRAGQKQLDRTILLTPSPKFVAELPFGRIPDRRDFERFKGKDRQRVRAWQTAAHMSRRLGEEFLELVETGPIRHHVRRIQRLA